MVQYYTLDEAAKLLNVTADKIKEMARKGEVRAFQDRGNLRFRSQEIDELARSMGLGSDPELQLGDALLLAGDPPSSPSGASRSPTPEDSGAVLDFQLSDSGRAPAPGSPSGSDKRKTTGGRASTLKAPPPVSSDSDVRLVSDGAALDFKIDDVGDGSASKSPRPAPKAGGSSKSKLKGPAKEADSGVRIVPLDQSSDSDVKLVGESDDSVLPLGKQKAKKPSDSDIRMDHFDLGLPGSGSKLRDKDMITEEIDLDAEALKAEESSRPKSSGPSKSKGGKPSAQLPTSSPFELSEDDMRLEKQDDDSDEFTLAPGDSGRKRSPLESSPMESSPLEAGSDEVPLIMGDDEVSLGELTGAGGGSGINLRDPADSGISLEQGGSDEIEFELTLDSERGNTPNPKSKAKPKAADDSDSSSEFELSIKDGDESGSSSEFELTLDGEESAQIAKGDGDSSESDSDSEFELTLDDSGGLAGAEEAGAEDAEEKDIFETDFEVPALDDESASEAVALDSDTDVETQDFDLSSSDSHSASQVVELDDEADAGAATIKRPSKKKRGIVAQDEETDLLREDEEPVEEEEDEPARVEYRDAPPAEWGVAAPLAALTCAVVLFFVALMSFELVQGMWGYHRSSKVSSVIVDPIARMFEDLPKQD